jgi:hypothetical protein
MDGDPLHGGHGNRDPGMGPGALIPAAGGYEEGQKDTKQFPGAMHEHPPFLGIRDRTIIAPTRGRGKQKVKPPRA